MTDPLAEAAERLFAAETDRAVRLAAGAGHFPHSLWRAVSDAGFPAALQPESGATAAEALSLVRVAAGHAAPVPLAETMLAGWLLARAGLPVPDGVLTLAPVRVAERLSLRRGGGGWHLTGTATRIPWARDAAAIVVLADAAVALVGADSLFVTHGRNLADEPRDTVAFDATLPPEAVAPAPAGFGPAQWHAAGAVLRTAQIAGALARVLALTVQYAQTRVQFGRAIGKFQAIQQTLAVLAGQCAAAGAAADMAAEAFAGGLPMLPVAAAKARAGEAASIAAGLAHQAHGAIGFTREYDLNHLTRRLWSWRGEFGNEAYWQEIVGRAAFAAGPDGLWPMLTAA